MFPRLVAARLIFQANEVRVEKYEKRAAENKLFTLENGLLQRALCGDK